MSFKEVVKESDETSSRQVRKASTRDISEVVDEALQTNIRDASLNSVHTDVKIDQLGELYHF